MTPNTDPNAYLAREIDQLANDFHAVGNHNRAIARDRISDYQERRLHAPTPTQMRSVVRGSDRYHKPPFPWRSILLLVVLAAAAILIVKMVMP